MWKYSGIYLSAIRKREIFLVAQNPVPRLWKKVKMTQNHSTASQTEKRFNYQHMYQKQFVDWFAYNVKLMNCSIILHFIDGIYLDVNNLAEIKCLRGNVIVAWSHCHGNVLSNKQFEKRSRMLIVYSTFWYNTSKIHIWICNYNYSR